jgi:hypothetical protein
MAKVLFDRDNSKDKNRQRCFQGYQGEIGESSRTIVFDFFDYVRVLFYTDDIKLFLPDRGFQDCIESDLNQLSEWCERNSFLNVDECKTITFSRTCYPVEFAYMLDQVTL